MPRCRTATVQISMLLLTGWLLMTGHPVAAQPAETVAPTAISIRPWACPSGLPPRVQCGRLEVPLDWSDPTNPQSVSIAYAVHRAAGERIGTLTFNPGGPGQSGVDGLGFMLGAGPAAMSLPPEVIEHFDIVAWDPRGVGYSGPALTECDRAEVAMGPMPQVGEVPWKQVASQYAKRLAKVLRACVDANPGIAQHLGTRQVIADLEALRDALRVEQWTYLGTSYGTTIGMAYARAHPDRIRALVLDGVAPPSQTILQAAGSQTPAWRAALGSFASVYPKAATLVQPVMDAMDTTTLTWRGSAFTRFPHQDDAGSLYQVMRTYLQNERGFTALRDLLTELGRDLDEPPADEDSSAVSTFDMPVNPVVSLVMCSDRPQRPTYLQAAALADRAEREGITVAGIPTLERSLWCAGLGELGRPLDSSTAPIELVNGALIVNAVGDIKTPYARAQVAAGQLPGSRLITYLGTIHGLYPRAGSDCINDAVTDYLITLRLPAADVTCPIAAR